jgi:hypothetical protein
LKTALHFLDANAEMFDLDRELIDNRVIQPTPKSLSMEEARETQFASSTITSVILQKLYIGLSRLAKEVKINDIFDSASDLLKELVKWDQVTFLLTDGYAIQAFDQEKQGILTNITINEVPICIASYNQKYTKKTKIKRSTKIKRFDEENTLFEPWFKNMDEAYYGKMRKGSMWYTVFKPHRMKYSTSGKENSMFAIIQWDKLRTAFKEPGFFSSNDHFLLKLICQFISQCFWNLIQKAQAESVWERSLGILQMFRNTSQEWNLANIYCTIKEYVPQIYRANKAWIFFIDHTDPNLMYTINEVGTDERGINFIKSVVKFPSNLGYTGQAFKTK